MAVRVKRLDHTATTSLYPNLRSSFRSVFVSTEVKRTELKMTISGHLAVGITVKPQAILWHSACGRCHMHDGRSEAQDLALRSRRPPAAADDSQFRCWLASAADQHPMPATVPMMLMTILQNKYELKQDDGSHDFRVTPYCGPGIGTQEIHKHSQFKSAFCKCRFS